ncbi:cytochrome c-type biogenesis protein CcmH [Conexibacter sp. CPCC 206217]|nr:cytochrome c-type biogenesis protein CcmH [Conexibacter sp. CPCC 206217]
MPAVLPTAALAQAEQQQPPQPKTSLYEIESQVMCVTCRTPLATAGGPQAQRERDLIRGLIAEGKTPDQIKAALVLEYGERVLAMPEEKGFNLAVYLVPIAVVVVALALAAMFLPRWRRHARAFAGAQGSALGPELDAADARRLDDDLKRYD